MTTSIVGLTVDTRALGDGESIEERVFATVRAALERAEVERSEIDAVVIAADDVADGRSITTMLHATAAGAHFRDEIRTTNGSLTALGLASLRVQAGLSRQVIVAGWWLPHADAESIAAVSLDAGYGRLVAVRERLAAAPAGAGSAACVVRAGSGDGLALDGFCFGQADYHAWLAGDGEPAAALGRLGRELAERCAPFTHAGTAVSVAPGDWEPFFDGAGLSGARRLPVGAAHHGLVDGLARLAAAQLHPGERLVVATTGDPAFLQVEAVAVSHA